MPKAAKEKKITGKKRGPYKSYKQDSDGEKELSSAIDECHAKQKANPNFNISSFAEGKKISYSRLYPYCRNDEHREVFAPKGQKKKIETTQMSSFCATLLAQDINRTRKAIISALVLEFPILDKTAAINQYNKVVKPTLIQMKNKIQSKISKNKFDTAVTMCIVENTEPIVALLSSISPVTMTRMVAPAIFGGVEVGWTDLSDELQSNILSYIHPLNGNEITSQFEIGEGSIHILSV